MSNEIAISKKQGIYFETFTFGITITNYNNGNRQEQIYIEKQYCLNLKKFYLSTKITSPLFHKDSHAKHEVITDSKGYIKYILYWMTQQKNTDGEYFIYNLSIIPYCRIKLSVDEMSKIVDRLSHHRRNL
jgi:hypothetical protein